MIKKLKSLNVKKILCLTMCLMLTLNLGVSNYFVKEANAVVIAEDPNRELTVEDIPDTILLNKLTELAHTSLDGKLTKAELQNYKGDSNGLLNLSNLNITSIKGLNFATSVQAIDLSGNNSLNMISDSAFVGFKNLVSITLPEGITSLGNASFQGCTSLKNINLPIGLTKIGANCFEYCTSLTEVVLPKLITTIGNSAFSSSGLLSIEIPNSTVSIGIDCFNASKNLKDVKLIEGMQSIPDGCFNSTGIVTIDIPISIQTIGAGAFVGSRLNDIDLSKCKSLTSINTSAFSGTPLVNINLPESLTFLGERVFEGCSYLPEIKIPSNVTVINNLTFRACSNLQSVIFTPTIIDGVTNYKLTEIKDKAFYQCYSLGGVDGNVTFLKDLNNLTKIGESSFAYCSLASGKDEYAQPIYYGIQSIILPENLKELGVGVLSNCGSLKTITIPNKVTVIENNAFQNCFNLQNVTLSNNLTSIGNYSFDSCKSINNIVFPASLIKIGSYAFSNCANEKVKTIPVTLSKEYVYTGMDALVLPDKLTDIGIGAFKNSFNIKTVKLPETLTQLKDYIFQGCGIQLKDAKGSLITDSYKGIESVIFPKSLESIGGYAFGNCYKLDLKDGSLPYTVKTIGANSFENCKSLTKVLVPSSVETIGVSSFRNCSALTNVNFEYATNLKSIGSSAFSQCTKLDYLDYLNNANSLVTIGTSAFESANIQGLLWLPNSIQTIGTSAFKSCKNISGVEFGSGLKTIGSSSFQNCVKLTGINMPSTATVVTSGLTSSFYGCDSLSKLTVIAEPIETSINENSNAELLVKCFTEINSVEAGNENIAKSEMNPSYLPVLVSGIKAGQTTITIKGTLQYETGKDAITGGIYVNRLDATVDFKVNVTANKCTEVKIDQPLKGLRLDNAVGITLIPIITTEDPTNQTTDLKTWKSLNTSVVTVNEKGVVKPVSYGTAVIELTVGDKVAQCTVNVCAPASNMTFTNVLNGAATLIIGNELPITPTVTYATAYSDIKTNYPDVVIWSSSNTSVATVDQTGKVKAIASGTAVIKAVAYAANITRTCTVTVIPEVTVVSFDNSEITLNKNIPAESIKKITMTLNPVDSPLSMIKVVSSNPLVATVSVTGNIITVTAKGGGTTTIKATLANGTGSECIVHVNSPINSLTTKSMELIQGSSRTIALTKLPIDATDKILYSSSNPLIATVDETGKVTAIVPGKAIITIKSEDGKVSTTCEVTVIVPVTGVTLTNTSAKLAIREKLQLASIVTVQPSNATNKAVTWSSTNPLVATVDTNGVVTAVGKGEAKIIVTTVDGRRTATYTITVSLPIIGGKNIDVNNDGNIDIIDLASVAKDYNSKVGSTLYNANYDFNSDNIIDIFDIVPVAKYIN